MNNKYDQLLSLLRYDSYLKVNCTVLIYMINIVFLLQFCWQPIKGFIQQIDVKIQCFHVNDLKIILLCINDLFTSEEALCKHSAYFNKFLSKVDESQGNYIKTHSFVV